MSYEMSEKIDQLSSAWHEFKAVNERRLTEIEKKNSPDPLLNEQIHKLNLHLDGLKDHIDYIDTKSDRPKYQIQAKIGQYDEYKSSFNNFLRKGDLKPLEDFEKKSLNSVRDNEGKILITPEISQTIISTINISSPMRNLASIEKISTDSLEIIESNELVESGWVNEMDGRPETRAANLGKSKIMVHELYAQPKATQKLIDDAFIDIEAWLAEKIAESFRDKENKAFISGDGNNQPKGILSYELCNNERKWGKIELVQSNFLDFDFLIDGLYSLEDKYAKKASFLMHRTSLHHLRSIKDNNGNYVWSPVSEVSKTGSLLGLPLVECDEMPIYGSGKILIAVADFKQAYKIVDRVGMQILRDPYTDKPFVKFYATKRVGGAVTNFDAIKLLSLKQ